MANFLSANLRPSCSVRRARSCSPISLKKFIKICKYLEFEEKSFEAFLKWVLNLRKDLNIPHKLSEVIDEKDFDLDKLSKLALDDPSTGGNPKKLNLNDMKIMYQHSMSGELFK